MRLTYEGREALTVLVIVLAWAVLAAATWFLITHGSDPSHTAAANDFLSGAVRGAAGP